MLELGCSLFSSQRSDSYFVAVQPATLLVYHIRFRLSIPFFNFFSNFFQLVFLAASLNLTEQFDKLFFSTNSPQPLFRGAAQRVLIYNNTFLSVCQHLFSIFYIFFQLFLIFSSLGRLAGLLSSSSQHNTVPRWKIYAQTHLPKQIMRQKRVLILPSRQWPLQIIGKQIIITNMIKRLA